MRIVLVCCVAASCTRPTPPATVPPNEPERPSFFGLPGLYADATHEQFGSPLTSGSGSSMRILRGMDVVCAFATSSSVSNNEHSTTTSSSASVVLRRRAPVEFDVQYDWHSSSAGPMRACTRYELPDLGSCRAVYTRNCPASWECAMPVTIATRPGGGRVLGTATMAGASAEITILVLRDGTPVLDERASDGSGRLDLGKLPPGPYVLMLTHHGTTTQAEVTVDADHDVVVDIDVGACTCCD